MTVQVRQFLNWYDQVVFSKNNIYGDSDDLYLTEQYISSSNGLPLDPNETYTVNRTVTLPSSVAVGSGYLLFKTDAYNYRSQRRTKTITFILKRLILVYPI
ncbi:MAG UNVERIFIED_CONTAM: hypothetical protein LVR29_05950 [Microcystis novacekii LVE1205-3]|jgi:hypothetical protein